MKVLVLGGTKLMGKHLVSALLNEGHDVTIATRGLTPHPFGENVSTITLERSSLESLQQNIPNLTYDLVFDSLAYCSNEVKYLLDTVKCHRYIQISTVSVYSDLGFDLKEESFNPWTNNLVYCDKADFHYGEIKRQAESAIVQDYPTLSSVMVRFPFVIGVDDYTKRFFFYVDHIVNQKPMFINNLDARITFVDSSEAGKFLLHLGFSDFTGPINAANTGTFSIRELTDYVCAQTNKKMILSESGDVAPYNHVPDFSLNVDQAASIGFTFSPLKHWVYKLIDALIVEATSKKNM